MQQIVRELEAIRAELGPEPLGLVSRAMYYGALDERLALLLDTRLPSAMHTRTSDHACGLVQS